MLLHVKHALAQGYKYLCIQSLDTDVLVILLGVFHQLWADYSFNDLVLESRREKDTKRVGIKGLAERLGQPLCQALPFLHTLSGSDTTSAFRGKAKKTAVSVLKGFPDAIRVFGDLFHHPFQRIDENSDAFNVIQRFVILMYSRTSEFEKVNDARLDMFFKNTQDVQTIPPTSNALLQHTRRAIFQAGVWSRCLEPQQNLPSPEEFGWKKTSHTSSVTPARGTMPMWEPVWHTNGEATKEIRELIKCACTADCVRCKCAKSNLRCTLLCKCSCGNKYSFA